MADLYTDLDRRRPSGQIQVEVEWRDAFFRDYGRVIHSACFRRLQGKTQVFPGYESDFFRNRLTHSLEVAQIAEGIADRLNFIEPKFQKKINPRICAAASLIHDLGHPPFGHNGERALDDAMRRHGGFEGNAQTLRIVANNERKVIDPESKRSYGLDLTYRTLAAVLKYDRQIPRARRKGAKFAKGYYSSEAPLVRQIKEHVAPGFSSDGDFRTIECAIMDIADDIAYSTFDLEDSMKVGFLSPAAMLASPPRLLERVAHKVSEELHDKLDAYDILDVIQSLFSDIAEESMIGGYLSSQNLATRSHLRTALSSDLVKTAIQAVHVDYDAKYPMLSKVYLLPEVRRRTEVLKQYTYLATIASPRLKIPEYRGYEVVAGIFEVLSSPKGSDLLPEDVACLYQESSYDDQMRCVCDFVAGMTDRYAMEFYGRLHSDSAQSMFKPI